MSRLSEREVYGVHPALAELTFDRVVTAKGSVETLHDGVHVRAPGSAHVP